MSKTLNDYVVNEVINSLGPREFPGSVLYGSTSDAIPITDKCVVDSHRHHYYVDKYSNMGRTDKAGVDGHWHLVLNGEIISGNHKHTLEPPQGSTTSINSLEDQEGIQMPVFQTELSKQV